MKNLSLLWKILIPLVIFAVLAVVAINLALNSMSESAALTELEAKARSIVNSAESTLETASSLQENNLFKDPIKDSLSQEEYLQTIPVLSSMKVAATAAEKAGGTLKVPSLNFRNPDNTPTEFEAEILAKLASSPNMEAVQIHEETGTLRYYKAITLDESCMICHGDPANPEHNIWGSTDGKDFMGFKMENMQPGDIKGAYEVIFPLDAVDEAAAADLSTLLITYLGPIVLLVIIGYMIYRIVAGEIKKTRSSIEKMKADFDNGVLDSRVDSAEVLVDLRPITESTNAMVGSLISPINVMSEYTYKLSHGEMPPVYTEDVKGEFNKFKDSINSLIETLSSFTKEISHVHYNHNEVGDIDVEMDPAKFDGFYKEMAIGVNELVASHIDVKKQAIGIISEYGNGNFEAKMPQLVGKKVFINNALNSVQDNLNGISSEINTLILSAKDGKLSVRGNSEQYEGDWKKIIEGLNDLMKEIDRPISESEQVLKDMAEGDLTAKMLGEYSGSFDNLKKNINELASSLQNLIGEVKDSVKVTSKTSNELTQTAETIAAGAQEQSSQSDDVASAVEEMSRTITENAMSAQRTAEMAQNNRNVASEGGAVVSQTLQKMRDIATVVESSASKIGKLGDSSQKINEIISVIDDIADQTNLLALNAAIEAARAGEQGRGFAVVADEVRKLAERTTNATKEISDMITGIQDETLSAVDAMNVGNSEVKEGIDLADRAGVALKEIVESSESVLTMINQIAAANEEQSSTAEEISKNVIAISEVSGDTAKRIEEIAQSADSLQNITTNLEVVMNKFKIEVIETDTEKSLNGPNLSQLRNKNGRGLRDPKRLTPHN